MNSVFMGTNLFIPELRPNKTGLTEESIVMMKIRTKVEQSRQVGFIIPVRKSNILNVD